MHTLSEVYTVHLGGLGAVCLPRYYRKEKEYYFFLKIFNVHIKENVDSLFFIYDKLRNCK